MSATSLATKGVICRRTVLGPPPVGGGGGGPIRRQEEIIMPKIKVKSVDISKDKDQGKVTENNIKITNLSLVID